MAVQRFDVSDLASKKMDNGWMRCDAVLTRTGVFEYKNPDGTVRREYRPPEEVFHKDATESFEQVPVTIDHPPVRLDSRSTKIYAKGSVSKIRQDGDRLGATALITDEEAIQAVMSGKKALSCGYTVELEEVPGVTPSGERYDAVQRKIRGNHVAIVSKARAGESATLRLDSAGGQTTQEPKKMKTLKLDGLSFEVEDNLYAIFEKRENELAIAKSEITKQTARADKAEEDLVEASKTSSKDEVSKAVTARLELVRSAEKVLPVNHGLKLDSMDDLEIKKAVVIKISPAAKDKIEKGDAAYVQARFDSILEEDGKPSGGLSLVRGAAQRMDTSPDGELDVADAARAAMMKRNAEMGKGK